MALNQGMGAGDPDKRLPPQQLNIIIPRYVNTYQILQGAHHVRSEGKYQGLKVRLPLVTTSFTRSMAAAWHRFRG